MNIKSQWKTTANKVTLVRILLIPLFVVVLLAPWPEWLTDTAVFSQRAEFIDSAIKPWAAAIVYAVLALTDGVDGYIARKRNEITTVGKFLDPIADKILVVAALVALVELGDLPSWPVLIIIAREFVVSGLRMIAASEGIVIAAQMSGKVKTCLTLIAILLFIIKSSSIIESLPSDIYYAIYIFSWAVMTAALVVTITSMVQYISKTFSMLGEKHAAENSTDFSGSTTAADAASMKDTAFAADAEPRTDAEPKKASLSVCDGISFDDKTYRLAEKVLSKARELGVHIASAESCSGGLVGGVLTVIPGSSDVYQGGVISYTYDVKERLLGVTNESLERAGAVSEEVALEMAQGAKNTILADFDLDKAIAVSITGVAGPGSSESKSQGTVWFGVVGRGEPKAICMNFDGDRNSVRSQAVQKALELIDERL